MARSAAFISIAKAGFQVNEYKPNEIKKNITGMGHASKQQVHVMVQKILKTSLENKIQTFDSMDALAVALCHIFQGK
jgi:crossover junction endodeoxyribonuclease RuvC